MDKGTVKALRGNERRSFAVAAHIRGDPECSSRYIGIYHYIFRMIFLKQLNLHSSGNSVPVGLSVRRGKMPSLGFITYI